MAMVDDEDENTPKDYLQAEMIRKELRAVAVSKGEMGIMAEETWEGKKRVVIRVATSFNLHKLPTIYYANVAICHMDTISSF